MRVRNMMQRGAMGGRLAYVAESIAALAGNTPFYLQAKHRTVYTDAGTTKAETAGAAIYRWVRNDELLADSPNFIYAEQPNVGNQPALSLHHGKFWLEGADRVDMVMSSSVDVPDLTVGDLTVLAVLHHDSLGTRTVACADGVGATSGAMINNDDVVHLFTSLGDHAIGYTGSVGDIVAIWTVESGTVYFRASGMVKATLGSVNGGFTASSLMGGEFNGGMWCDTNNRVALVMVAAASYSDRQLQTVIDACRLDYGIAPLPV